jgi:hypothetical protein
MPLTPSLLDKVTADVPDISFTPADDFLWSPAEKTIYYTSDGDTADALLLHELAHGLLDHHEYAQDVSLLTLEMHAWEKARELAVQYGVPLNEDDIQDHLDTYRDWLHARSTCPECEATGYEEKPRHYRCIACTHSWRVNEARTCGLKRYTTKETP